MSTVLKISTKLDSTPYTFPLGWSVKRGTFKVLSNGTSGVLRVNSGSPSVVVRDLPTSPSTTQYKVRFQIGYPQGGSDWSGAVFASDSTGNGYYAAVQGTQLVVNSLAAWNAGGNLGTATVSATTAGEWFTVTFDIAGAASVIKVYRESVSTVTPALTKTALTFAADMRAGLICNSGNNNSEGVQEVTVDYGNPSIAVYASTYALGVAIPIATSGLGTLTSVSVDGVLAASVSAPSGTGAFTLSSWVVGQVSVPFGAQYVSTTDGVKTTGVNENVITLTAPVGKAYVELLTVNSGAGYLNTLLVSAGATALSVGDQILFNTVTTMGLNPVTQSNFIDDDGGVYTDYVGSQTLLIRRVATGVVEQIILTTTNTPVITNSLPTVTSAKLTYITCVINATDANSDALTYSVTSQGSKGVASIANGSVGKVKYTPNNSVSGTDSFTVKVTDSKSNGDVFVTVTVNIDTWVMSTAYGSTSAITRS